MLIDAIVDKDTKLVECLLNGVLDPNQRSYDKFYQTDKSPLDIAIGYKDLDMIHTILNAGADPNSQNKRGDNSLLVAFGAPLNRVYGIVKQLMPYGADPTIQNKYGETAYTILDRYRWHMDEDAYEHILELFDSFIPIKKPDRL